MILCLILVGGISVWRSALGSTPSSGVAVVELFTSEGCSSCPPAERLLGELARDAEHDGRPVFTLAFHVDYWNGLGWADRFSDPAFSQRQRDYARTLHVDEIYTPQMVVNGTTQFVGSDRDGAARAIAGALAGQSAVTMTVQVNGNKRDGYTVHATTKGAGAGAVVNIAVVERGLATDVKSGENKGRRLEEPSVVRWFKSVPLSDAGTVIVPPLAAVQTEHTSVIVYTQQPGNGPIFGAAATSLPATVPSQP
jgi:hypothetical protein